MSCSIPVRNGLFFNLQLKTQSKTKCVAKITNEKNKNADFVVWIKIVVPHKVVVNQFFLILFFQMEAFMV